VGLALFICYKLAKIHVNQLRNVLSNFKLLWHPFPEGNISLPNIKGEQCPLKTNVKLHLQPSWLLERYYSQHAVAIPLLLTKLRHQPLLANFQLVELEL
jgi:hypothetical protein